MLTNGGNILYYQQTTPPDSQVASYDALEGSLIQDESITTLTSNTAAKNIVLDTDGYMSSNTASYAYLAYVQTMKARAANTTRVYTMWGSTKSTQGTTNYVGPQITFNRLDSANYWAAGAFVNNSSWYINMWKYVAGVYTKHVDQAFTMATRPFYWQLSVVDNGDYCSVRIQGGGTTGGSLNQFGAYTVASRPHKSEVRTIFYMPGTDASAHWKFQGCSIIDYPST
jgi:hypothetical protein